MTDLIDRHDALVLMTDAIWHYPNELYKDLNQYENAAKLAQLGLMGVLPAAPEYTEAEKKLMKMMFGMINTIMENQDGYMDISRMPFSRDDLFTLSEKLGIGEY